MKKLILKSSIAWGVLSPTLIIQGCLQINLWILLGIIRILDWSYKIIYNRPMIPRVYIEE